MAAYAALVSLMQILDQIEHHPSPPISMDKKQVESLTEIVMFLQEFLEGYKSPYADGDEADPLEMRIADAVYAAEDVIESHIVDRIRPPVLVLYEALRDVIEDMDSVVAGNEGMLLRQVSHIWISEEDLYEIMQNMRRGIQLIEKRVKKHMDLIFTLKYHLQRQVSDSADLYKIVMKVIQHMDFIKNEVMEIFAFKDQLQRQVLAYADEKTYEVYHKTAVVDFIEDVDLLKNEVMEIFAFKDQLPKQVLPSANSSIYANMDLDLIKKHMMEIIAIKDQLEIQVSASSDSSTYANFHESLQKVIQGMDLIKKDVMKVVALKDHTQVYGGSSTSSFSRLNNTTMVGFDDVMIQLMEKLVYGEQSRQVIPIVGMGGIGKTTLAEYVYAHPSIGDHFDICAWVTISQQFSLKELLGEILSQANKQRLSEMREDEIGLSLHKCLSHRRYLIVLDDMWSIEAWEKMQLYFPDNGNGSRIMVTTRLSNLGSQLNNNYSLEMEFMNEESSWNMFSKIVFEGESCPLELEKIGKKIVENCRGLPLSIVVVGGLLEKLKPTKKYWESIRRSVNSLVNSEDGMHCLKILKLSYNHLPVYLKPCFLYLGMFEEDSKIRVSTLIKLWVSEGFVKPVNGKSLETIVKEYLDELVARNLILVHEFGRTGSMKYLKIHDLLRDLCLREAVKERFYHVVGQHNPLGTSIQRRVVIPRNTSKKEVLDAMSSTPHVRSYISEYERVQLLPNLRLLRTLRAYDQFSHTKEHSYSLRELFKLVNLRYLAVFHKDGSQLPSSINLLWSLQTLILHSLSIKNALVEIWNMSQLRHVDFYVDEWLNDGGLHLPDPPSDKIVIMENLQTLIGVSNFKCDEMMVRSIPNIKKLGLSFPIPEGIESGDDYCLHNIERLPKLESLSCKGEGRSGLLQKLTFPDSLKSLTLGTYINRIEDILKKASALPLLQKLKLRGGDFTAGKWETVEGQFPSLKYLELSLCSGLKWWMTESSHFPCLEHISLSWVSLKEFPAELGEIPTLKSVRMCRCSGESVISAKRMVEEQEELQGEEELSFKVSVILSSTTTSSF
ncbi:putative late blight resistance protein homolog R1A-3 [Salvia hispanica]|uniref:putative late blight resistance protein homolog R1A-3 n=1 Tax=Salvia hispanica TaxID=49212 RepID=UPI002009C44F|nr:putative late blight resistance protein homolog R1A-3 [Salvia hispanica]